MLCPCNNQLDNPNIGYYHNISLSDSFYRYIGRLYKRYIVRISASVWGIFYNEESKWFHNHSYTHLSIRCFINSVLVCPLMYFGNPSWVWSFFHGKRFSSTNTLCEYIRLSFCCCNQLYRMLYIVANSPRLRIFSGYIKMQLELIHITSNIAISVNVDRTFRFMSNQLNENRSYA